MSVILLCGIADRIIVLSWGQRINIQEAFEWRDKCFPTRRV